MDYTIVHVGLSWKKRAVLSKSALPSVEALLTALVGLSAHPVVSQFGYIRFETNFLTAVLIYLLRK
jgi:hypothetical protein